MPQFLKEVDHFFHQLTSSSLPTYGDLQQALATFVENASDASKQERETALHRLSPLITEMNPLSSALLAMGCGALIEIGADAHPIASAILHSTRSILKAAPAFALACQNEVYTHAREGAAEKEPLVDPNDIEACLENYGAQVAQSMPEEAEAWAALDPICTAALAVVMRLPELRADLRNDADFGTLLHNLPVHTGGSQCLSELLKILDNEEFLVLHPALKRGYRIRIRGVADNFQLHILLADTLIGVQAQGWLPGERPDPRVAAAAKDGPFPIPGEDDTTGFPHAQGAFNLWNWQGLQPDAINNSKHWIWNEGKPADISFFEGIRVILLSPPPYVRTWNAGRYFPGLPGELEVQEILSLEQVNHWLSRIAATKVR